jgi:RimJ/RimL family protein N-acetyltransferase
LNFNAGPAPPPERVTLPGRWITVAPLDPFVHGDSLWEKTGGARNAALWDHMPDGPFPERGPFDEHLVKKAASPDPMFFAIVDNAPGEAAGHASLMRIDAKNRVIEVGGIMYSPALQRRPGGTEAMYLLARYVFEDLGYRRYEWKCNALNSPSRAAALRYGFTFEGIFRQHMIVKGRNRDTAWFSMLDSEWPARRQAFEEWLRPENFDESGVQKSRLGKAAVVRWHRRRALAELRDPDPAGLRNGGIFADAPRRCKSGAGVRREL